MCGLGERISTVFEILEHLWFKGDWTILYGYDQNTNKWSLTQGTKIYIWFRGRDLNGSQEIRAPLF
jgi:hypothetical protein